MAWYYKTIAACPVFSTDNNARIQLLTAKQMLAICSHKGVET